MKITTIPQIYRHANRWREILTILSKYGLAGWISRFDVPLVKGILKNREGEALAHLSRETRIRMAIEELGPTFIKLGQILSTRPDQIGMALAGELQKLQTSVPADDAATVRETIQSELGQPLEEAVQRLSMRRRSPRRRSARSTGPGCRVAPTWCVKVQHAGISRRMEVDLDILAGLAQLAERIPELVPYRPVVDSGRVSPRRATRARLRPRSSQHAAVRAQLPPQPAMSASRVAIRSSRRRAC